MENVNDMKREHKSRPEGGKVSLPSGKGENSRPESGDNSPAAKGEKSNPNAGASLRKDKLAADESKQSKDYRD